MKGRSRCSCLKSPVKLNFALLRRTRNIDFELLIDSIEAFHFSHAQVRLFLRCLAFFLSLSFLSFFMQSTPIGSQFGKQRPKLEPNRKKDGENKQCLKGRHCHMFHTLRSDDAPHRTTSEGHVLRPVTCLKVPHPKVLLEEKVTPRAFLLIARKGQTVT